MTTNALLTAELAIYAVLSLPVLYLLIRHSPAGLLGWFYLFAFCTLRIVGGAVSASPASIISSIGLSPLLLAGSGILHEARIYHSRVNRAQEWSLVAVFHLLVATGVALVGSGASDLQSDHPTSRDLKLVKVGIGLLTASWAVLCLWTGISCMPSQKDKSAPRHRQGITLLRAVAFSLVPIGIRVLYALVALTTRRRSLNPVTGSLAARVVLGLLPELITTLVLIIAGMRTRNASRVGNEKAEELMGDSSQGRHQLN
ncbi:uncharacterized protein P884DRAFT_240045 [Thermothelomyces heterothallicus CBS 202.75]|uniref:uncharacterized protein n=1 Tax=Thermothelomyces heterothallicus CBS 202.75 TaxID=1149848 RepID=UPI0037435925